MSSNDDGDDGDGDEIGKDGQTEKNFEYQVFLFDSLLNSDI